jgi:NAD(P)-dependent dehydrogenase (short-subunit alcohol dehydrogenase family)
VSSRRPIEQTTALVTGATDGLGRSLAIELARNGVTVLVHGRDPGRGEAAVAAIREASGNPRVELHLADFASLDEVRGLAEALQSATDEVNLLVNNAGIGTGLPAGRERQESLDGYELRFAVNYLAGFLLTELLLPLLRRSAPARIVNVASLGQHPIDFDDPMITRGYSGARAYSQSKLAQIMQAIDLAESLPAAEVTANSLHPATFMPTKMVLAERAEPVDSLELGTRAVVRLALDSELDGVSGRFFDRLAEGAAHPQAYDPRARAELRRLSEELVAPRLD